MSRVFRWALGLSLLFSVHGHAAPLRGVTAADPTCVALNDEFETGYRYTQLSKLNRGQCVDTRRYRPLTDLRLTNADVTFSNYMHDDRFWRARLKLDAGLIERVYFHIVRFNVVEGVAAAHTQIRFQLKPDALELSRAGQTARHDDLLVSFEAGLPPGQSYNFALGAFNAYALVGRVLSTSQKLAQSTNRIEQYELNLNPAQRLELLLKALQRSADLGIDTFYSTLRPNCTTEVFDLLDATSGVTGKSTPFMTMLSVDPIATPSLRGLRRRELLVRRVQDFNDEFRGLRSEPPIPQSTSKLRSFFPNVDGQPWAVVIALPDDAQMTPDQRAVLQAVREQMVLALPNLAQSFAATMMLGDQREIAGQLLAETFQAALRRLPQTLRRLDSQLPPGRNSLQVYFAPHAVESGGTSLEALGIPAAVPFPVREYRVPTTQREAAEIYARVSRGIQDGVNQGARQSRYAFLGGIALTVHLERGQTQVITQVLAGLEAGEFPASVRNPQVEISRIVIPAPRADLGRPLSLITHVQQVRDEAVKPQVWLDFGPWGGVGGTASEYGYGSLQVFRSDVSCEVQQSLAPVIRGVFAGQATGRGLIDRALAGRPVDFHFLRALVRLDERRISETKVRISAVGLQCLNVADAERQFGEALTEQLRSAVDGLDASEILRRLTPFF